MCLRTEQLYHAILFSHKPNSITKLLAVVLGMTDRPFKTPPTTELLAKLHAVKPARQSHGRTRRAFPGLQGERRFSTIGFNASRRCFGDRYIIFWSPRTIPFGNPLKICHGNKKKHGVLRFWVAREDCSVAAHSKKGQLRSTEDQGILNVIYIYMYITIKICWL